MSTPVSTISTEAKITATIENMMIKVGAKGCDPFPMIDGAWEIFAGKGIRTVFLSIGNSKSALADLEIAESIGCPLNCVPLGDSEVAQWSEVTEILKQRKREESASPFSEGVEAKWVLPKNIRVQPQLPWWTAGTIDMSGVQVTTKPVSDVVDTMCSVMKLKDGMKRLDILKIDTTASAPGLEVPLTAAILSAGFRPSILIVNWTTAPDTDLATTNAAGHLQCCGYSMMNKLDNKFLYYFNDENLYEICSWEQLTSMNPIAQEIIKTTSKRSL